MATAAHKLVYRDNFTMGGGAYRLVFTIEPHPHDGDWWTVFHARATAVGLTSQVLELLDDGQAATHTAAAALLERAGRPDRSQWHRRAAASDERRADDAQRTLDTR